MKIPKTGSSQQQFWGQFCQNPELVLRILQLVPDSTVNGRYVSWEKLSYLQPPEELDHESWWIGLKSRRKANNREIPLTDMAGQSFSFNLVDPLPEHLHDADSSARGMIGVPDPIANPETRIQSLIDESITSSQLEGASTTRDIARKMIREGRNPRDRSERMIFNNYRTMQEIIRLKDRELSKELVFEIQQMVTTGTMDDPGMSGRFRRPEENIVVGDDSGQVFHRPPAAGQLEGRMALMCDFANGKAPAGFIHPLIRSIILHFWLAYDHPFVDGNGRTARALFYWSMLHRGYWLFEFLSISNIILKAPTKYGRAFLHTETDENDLTYFLLYHAEVVQRAIKDLHANLARRARRLREVEAELRGLTALNHRQKDLVAHALRHPGQRYSIKSHGSSHDVVYQTARTDLLDLESRGLLTKTKVNRVWYFIPAPDMEAKLREA